MSKLAVSYVRFSTPGQATGDSLTRQMKAAIEYAAENDLVLDKNSYQDLGISAFKGRNVRDGALGAFLKAVDDGLIPKGSTLLVENIDRLSRAQVDEALELFLSIIRRGITIVTLQDKQVYSSARIKEDRGISLIISITYMMRAHEESTTKSVRVRAGIAKRRAEGIKGGKLPFWLKFNGTEYEVLEPEANIVRQMFRSAAAGIGAHTIARTLNEQGGTWLGPNIIRVLRDPKVIGFKTSRSGYEPLSNHYPQIITNTLFSEVQAVLSRRAEVGKGRQTEDVPNLFSGLLRCGHCGASLRFSRKQGAKYSYLKCLNALFKRGDCEAPTVQYNAIESELLAYLLFDQDEELVKLVQPKKEDSPKSSVQAELDQLKEQEQRLLDLVTSGVLTDTATIGERLNKVTANIKALKATVDAIPSIDDDPREAVERAMSLFVEHEERSHDDDLTRYYEIRREIRTAFQKAMKRIDVLGDEVKIKFVWD